MSDLPDDSAAPPRDAADVPMSAGAVLRAAREGAGLSIDDVAQQLKLAPRQVHALEADDFARLPGRTFVRGFVRNYARYVGLPTDDVVALLPGADVAPSLERPTITPSGRPMGLLPTDTPARRGWTWWAIPLALLAIVAAAGYYELRRPQVESRRPAPDKAVSTPPLVTPQPSGNGTASAVLPNPLGDGTGAAPPSTSVTSSAPPAGSAAGPGGAASTPANAPAAAPATGAPMAASGTTANAATDNQLVLTFKGTSWVQVRDRNGNVVLAQNGQPGTSQAVSGAAPLDIVIGNAAQVVVTFRGQPVDLGPYVRGDVARLSVK